MIRASRVEDGRRERSESEAATSRPPMASPSTLAGSTRKTIRGVLPAVVQQEAMGDVSEEAVRPFVVAAVAFVLNHLQLASMHVEDYATPDDVDSEVTFAADVRESLEAFGVHLSIFTVQKHHDYVVVGTTVGKIDPVMSARACKSGRMGLYPPTCTLSRRFCCIVMLRGLHKRGPLASVSVPSSCTSVWEPKPGRLVSRRSLNPASGSCL